MRYQKIHVQIWHDEKFISLTDDARYLFLYILTSPHNNSLGVYFLPQRYAAADLGWDEKRLREPFQELLAKGLILYDERVKLVCIKNHLKHNVIENENQAKAAAKLLATLPKSSLYSHTLELLREPFHKPLREQLREQFAEQYAKPEAKERPKERTKDMCGKPGKIELSPLPTDALSEPPSAKLKPEKISYDFVTGRFLNITDALRTRWAGAYPAVDVPSELQRVEAWTQANPKNRKSNWERFIVNWFSKTQDRAKPINEKEAKDGSHKLDNQDARTPAGGIKAPAGKYARVAKTLDSLTSANPHRLVEAGKQGNANTAEILGQGVNPERPCE